MRNISIIKYFNIYIYLPIPSEFSSQFSPRAAKYQKILSFSAPWARDRATKNVIISIIIEVFQTIPISRKERDYAG